MPLQLEVLSTLADEQALHLLPPLPMLPGPAAAYLDTPATTGSSGSGGAGAFGRACFGGPLPLQPGAAAGGGSSGSSRRQELDFYVKLLTEGALERCLAASSSSTDVANDDNGSGDGGRADQAAGSSEGDGGCCTACSAALPLVLQRLACACFPFEAAAGSTQQQVQVHVQQPAQQQALLCSLLQRCAQGGSPGLLRLLGWLLRWDTSAGQPSDAISSARLAAVQAAAAAAGINSASLLQAAVEG